MKADATMTYATLTTELAERLGGIALGHVRREYPHASAHVATSSNDFGAPRERHPIFYGSFDWHSCAHSYWTLAYLRRRFPAFAHAAAIDELFGTHLVADKVARECDYFERPTARGFERPYGWAWLLKLAAELSAYGDRSWCDTLAPLARLLAERLRAFLALPTYPVRSGTHTNTAFAIRLTADYADAAEDRALVESLDHYVRRAFLPDADCPAWGEPGGDDFLSPTLIEAECVRRLRPADDFVLWFERFLPNVATGEPATLFTPASVADRADGKLAHLDGLNLSRAWCWRALATALPSVDARRTLFARAADRHLEVSLPQVAGDYMGEHWLATYAVLALE